MRTTRTTPVYTLEMNEDEAILLLALLGDMTFSNWKTHLDNYNGMFAHIKQSDTENFYDSLTMAGLVVPDN